MGQWETERGRRGNRGSLNMESEVKEALGTKVLKLVGGGGGGGCISEGAVYLTDGGRVFVKVNDKPNALRMFEGEAAGLEAILGTGSVKAPKPLRVVASKVSTRVALVMEALEMTSLGAKGQKMLGKQLAQMHLTNGRRLEVAERNEGRNGGGGDGKFNVGVREFGFDVPTSCGYLSQDNSWQKDWTTFFVRQRLAVQVDLILKENGDRELNEFWPVCMKRIEEKLRKVGDIVPSLVHGDLWSGNVAASEEVPVIFDPAAFYGHSEFDFGIANMFGGFTKEFFTAYHEEIPQAEGFGERKDIYELFHHLNHWNHFGCGYRGSTLSLMKKISRT